MVRTEYSAVCNVEVRGLFVSLVTTFLVLFLLLSLVTAFIVLAVLLDNEKGKAIGAGVIKDDHKGFGKRNYCCKRCSGFKHRRTPSWY